jgi:DNA-binding transcriptional LysR family regulator
LIRSIRKRILSHVSIDFIDMSVTLEQWRMFIAVVDAGGFGPAAQAMHRSQSAVSSAVAKLQRQLGVVAFRVEGRRARLTAAGEALLREARRLVADAADLQTLAGHLARGWEPEVRVVVDAAFPTALLARALHAFAADCRGTRLQLAEVVLSGADEALIEGRADLAVAAFVPPGFLGDVLVEIDFVAVVAAGHPLARRARISTEALRRERQIVIRDSGVRIKRDVGWLGAAERWTVSQLQTALDLVRDGLGFAWLPRHMVAADLAGGTLRPLALSQGGTRRSPLHLILARPEQVGPAAAQFANLLRQAVAGAAQSA